jgi:hypothetical protein
MVTLARVFVLAEMKRSQVVDLIQAECPSS